MPSHVLEELKQKMVTIPDAGEAAGKLDLPLVTGGHVKW